MSRRLTGLTHAGHVLAIAACSLVLVTACTRAQTPVGATETGVTESVVPTEPASEPPISSDDASSPSSTDSPSSPAGGGGSGSSGSSSSTGASGSGDNGDNGGNQAPGSPIDVPTIPEKHVTMDEIRAGIPDLFITACGGHDLCVKLEYGSGPCFAGYDPATKAQRGSTVRVLTESQEDCDRANGVDGSGSPTDGTTPQDPGTPTDVPSSGTSVPTDVPTSGPSDPGTGGASVANGQPDGSSG